MSNGQYWLEGEFRGNRIQGIREEKSIRIRGNIMCKVSEFRETGIGQKDIVEEHIKNKKGEAEEYLQIHNQKSKVIHEHCWTSVQQTLKVHIQYFR